MNWPEAFTGLVGCRVPLQQAGMGGVTTPALAAAVAREGGLGMIAAAGMAADDVVAQMSAARDSTGDGACIGVNFLMPFLDEEVLEQEAEAADLVEVLEWRPACLHRSTVRTDSAQSRRGRSDRLKKPRRQRERGAT